MKYHGSPVRIVAATLAVGIAAACSGPEEAAGRSGQGELDAREYATQLDAPIPDYHEMNFTIPDIPLADLERAATAKPPANAKALGDLWLQRLGQHVGGAGLAGKDPDDAVIMMDVLLTPAEFDALLAKNDWTFPDHIDLRFQNALAAPSVSPAARDKIRIWPASQIRTGIQNQALLRGRVVVKDSCFFLQDHASDKQPDRLAWFLAETGIDVDPEGYLVLIDRNTGHLQARVGEDMVWAGPNGVVATDSQLAALKEACGDYPVASVGNPEAAEKFYVKYPHTRGPMPPPPPPPAPPSN